MKTNLEFINGICQQFLFSPKGEVEGVLVSDNGTYVQVAMPSDIGSVFARSTGPGTRVCVLAAADRSRKTKDSPHRVYQFESFADDAGKAINAPDADSNLTTLKGVVAAMHYARHGQPNGVVLQTGEFIHLRPSAMVDAGLDVGSKVSAIGHVRLTVLGNRLLEARKVNRAQLH
jgi:hypothetical protein